MRGNVMGNTAYEKLKKEIEDFNDERTKSLQEDLHSIGTAYRNGDMTGDECFELLGVIKGLAKAELDQLEFAREQLEERARKRSESKA
jgi:hypothetical protein